MADPVPDPDAGTPRWVKVAGIVSAVLIVLIVVAVLTGRHEGPRRHAVPETGIEHTTGRR